MRAPYWASGTTVGRRSSCVSCGAERIRWYTRTGEVVNRYRYQDGYLHKRDAGDEEPAPSRQDWRKRLVLTLFEDLGQPQVTNSTHPSKRKRQAAS